MGYKEIEAQDAILLIVRANHDELCGRTILQKLAYFWTLYISDITNAVFTSHYYGPYSAEVRQALTRTVTRLLMDENTTSEPLYGRYHYKITKDAKSIVDTLVDGYKDEFERMKQIIKICIDSNSFQYDELSHAAKTHYVRNKMSKDASKSVNEIIEKARSFGWVMEQEKVENGTKLLKKLERLQR